MKEQRRLAAILVADVVGYSRLVGADETGTLARLMVLRRGTIDPIIARHAGRLFKETGDGFLAEFTSAVQAVTCAVEIQKAAGAKAGEATPLQLRVGIHLGDVVVQGDDLMGDGVNIAARLEGIADPGGVAVSRAVHEQVRDRLAISFNDKGEIDLKNIARPVHVFVVAGSKAGPAAATALPLPDKPSIAVLPFQNMSGDLEQEYFADGVVEDIITALSRFRELFVIARNSSFTYKGKPVDVRQVARELGVRYVLEGSSRKSGNRVRVTAQLIDCANGTHLWAERYDRELSDIFTVQEEITRTIAARVAPAIEASVLASIGRIRPTNLAAHEIAARAWSEANAAYLSSDAALRDRAMASARRALELDSECIRAWVTMAFLQWLAEFYSGGEFTLASCELGFDAARRAIALDRSEHRARMVKGLLHVRVAQYDDALAELREACELNPNDANALNDLAYGELMSGNGVAAQACILETLRLSPRDPMRYNLCSLVANACFLTEEYAEGLKWVAESKREHPNFPPTISIAIKLYVGLGQIDRARAEADLARRFSPHTETRARLGLSTLRRPEDREREVRFLRIGYGQATDIAISEAVDEPLVLPDKPSIAILPFQNMSGDPEQEYFADGIVEDIITALSRFKSLFVIARNSSFTYKGKAIDIKQVGRELGVRYVLEGSVRKAGGRVRITGQLIDSETGAHLWADRFDGPLKDIFELQDQVTTSVVGAIVPALNSAELKRAKRTPVENLDAYDCLLRGMAIFRQFTHEACTQALHLYYRAIELDPDFATPYGMATHFYSSSKLQGWAFDREQAEAEVRRLSERVSALGQNDASALCAAGFSLVWVCREYDAGAAFVDKAILINPNLAGAWIQRGAVSTFRGGHEAALDQFGRVRRISPLGTDLHLSQGYAALPYLFIGRYEEAARCALDAVSHVPNWLVGPLASAAANGFLRNAEDAHKSLTQLRRIRPDLRLSNLGETFTYRRPEDLARLVEGLRLAGLPD